MIGKRNQSPQSVETAAPAVFAVEHLRSFDVNHTTGKTDREDQRDHAAEP
jgi:hypothetical protein